MILIENKKCLCFTHSYISWTDWEILPRLGFCLCGTKSLAVWIGILCFGFEFNIDFNSSVERNIEDEG